MIVFLPNEHSSLTDLENRLTTINLTEELKGFRNTIVNLKIPKFKLEQTIDLSNLLKKVCESNSLL